MGWPANLISFASSHRVTDSRCIAQYTISWSMCIYIYTLYHLVNFSNWNSLFSAVTSSTGPFSQCSNDSAPTGEAWPWWRWHWCGRGDPWRRLRQRRSGGKKPGENCNWKSWWLTSMQLSATIVYYVIVLCYYYYCYIVHSSFDMGYYGYDSLGDGDIPPFFCHQNCESLIHLWKECWLMGPWDLGIYWRSYHWLRSDGHT